MLPYWLLLGLCSLLALGAAGNQTRQGSSNLALTFGGIVIALIIGLRYQVGGDWGSYLNWLNETRYMSIWNVITDRDPGYTLINWIALRLGLYITFVNLVCAAIFSAGLITLCRTVPQPWIALTAAVPYLIIVIAMGYTRQAVAIGFGMMVLGTLRTTTLPRLLALTFLAVTFHKTAIILLPIIALSRVRNRVATGFSLVLAALTLYYVFISSDIDRLVSGYIEAEYQSQGAYIRVAMNSLAAGAFMIIGRRFDLSEEEYKLWRNFALASIACIPALYYLSSSTVIDRLALYLIPIQLIVYGHAPNAFGSRRSRNSQIMLLIIAYSALIQFVWLNFANHAEAWVPYKMVPLFN